MAQVAAGWGYQNSAVGGQEPEREFERAEGNSWQETLSVEANDGMRH
jgi:hypothetical protein